MRLLGSRPRSAIHGRKAVAELERGDAYLRRSGDGAQNHVVMIGADTATLHKPGEKAYSWQDEVLAAWPQLERVTSDE